MSDELIDAIFEAAVLPDAWPHVLDGLSRVASAVGTTLFTSDTQSVFRWTSSPSIRPLMERWVAEDWQARCQRPMRMLKANRQGFIRDVDVYTHDELEADESYHGFFRPNGLGWAAGTFVNIPTGDVAVFSIERAHDLGPVIQTELDALDELRPHLSRAALLSIRLERERVRSAVQLLEALGLPATAVTASGQVVVANTAFSMASEHLTIGAYDRLMFKSPAAEGRVRDVLAGIRSSGRGGSSLPLRSSSGDASVLHIVPVRRAVHDIMGRSDAFIIVTPVAAKGAPDAALIAGLFDLSDSEARVAAQVSQGMTIDAIALRQGVSRETIRSHLKSVFIKLGVHRQAELVAVLANIPNAKGT